MNSYPSLRRVRSSLKIGRFIPVVLLFLLFGCTPLGRWKGENYFSIFNRWTRSVRVYEDLDTRIYVSATYRVSALRRAYVEEYAERYLLSEDLKEGLLRKEMEEAEGVNEFFLAVFTPDERWNDLDREDSVWSLYLVDDRGRRLLPISIRRIREEDPVIREFYPSLDLWSFGYMVRFPAYTEDGEPFPGPDTRSVTLIITGALGRAELTWSMEY